MGQLQVLSDQLEQARSRYDAATAQLAHIEHEQQVNRHELKVAKHNLKASQKTIANRLLALYSGDQESTLEVILGASSLDDMITRIDNAKSVSSADASILGQVKQFRRTIDRSAILLKRANAEEKTVVAERAYAKHQIESKIAEQQRLLSSIHSEIAKLEAADRAHALQLKREAEIRLAAQRAQNTGNDGTIVGITATSAENDTVVAPPPTHSNVVGYALSQIGVPYVWGGATPGVGFDCSGLVMWAYSQVGVSLPHSSYAMWGYGVPVSRDQLQPGDIVFFDGLGHVGLYIGNDQFVEAPHTGTVVSISSLDSSWYAATYVGARRIL